jgi:hypothetical protein
MEYLFGLVCGFEVTWKIHFSWEWLICSKIPMLSKFHLERNLNPKFHNQVNRQTLGLSKHSCMQLSQKKKKK